MIWGPGWPWAKTEILLENQKLYYSKSKIALNLHLQEQIDWPCELNERTYILAACKVPQLLDNPALIKYRFSEDSYFSATSPKEYLQLMNYMIQNEEEVKWRTDKIYEEVLSKHTTFHRMEHFISFLNTLNDK
jgi:spore maturation protein CgeB